LRAQIEQSPKLGQTVFFYDSVGLALSLQACIAKELLADIDDGIEVALLLQRYKAAFGEGRIRANESDFFGSVAERLA